MEFVIQAYFYARDLQYKFEGFFQIVVVLHQSVQSKIYLMNVALLEQKPQMVWIFVHRTPQIENRVKDQCKFQFRGLLLILLKPLPANHSQRNVIMQLAEVPVNCDNPTYQRIFGKRNGGSWTVYGQRFFTKLIYLSPFHEIQLSRRPYGKLQLLVHHMHHLLTMTYGRSFWFKP